MKRLLKGAMACCGTGSLRNSPHHTLLIASLLVAATEANLMLSYGRTRYVPIHCGGDKRGKDAQSGSCEAREKPGEARS